MVKVETSHPTAVVLLAAGLALTGPTLAQVPAAPKVPMAVNAPGAAPDAPPPKSLSGPAPISPATPRVGPAPAGQVVADDYRIGSQDLLEIQVYGIDNLKRDVRVNSRGAISLPLVGTVIVGGLTGEEAETLIAAKYEKDYLQDPQVSVFIKEYTSQRITLEGAVAKPGIYPIRGETSLMQAIAIAGGQGQLSDLHEVMVYRREGADRKILTYDLDKIRAGEAEDPSIVNDDVIVVKRAPGRVAIRDSLLGDIINIFNPFNYLPRYASRCPITTGPTWCPRASSTALEVRRGTEVSTHVLPPVAAASGGRREPALPRPVADRRQAQVGGVRRRHPGARHGAGFDDDADADLPRDDQFEDRARSGQGRRLQGPLLRPRSTATSTSTARSTSC